MMLGLILGGAGLVLIIGVVVVLFMTGVIGGPGSEAGDGSPVSLSGSYIGSSDWLGIESELSFSGTSVTQYYNGAEVAYGSYSVEGDRVRFEFEGYDIDYGTYDRSDDTIEYEGMTHRKR